MPNRKYTDLSRNKSLPQNVNVSDKKLKLSTLMRIAEALERSSEALERIADSVAPAPATYMAPQSSDE